MCTCPMHEAVCLSRSSSLPMLPSASDSDEDEVDKMTRGARLAAQSTRNGGGREQHTTVQTTGSRLVNVHEGECTLKNKDVHVRGVSQGAAHHSASQGVKASWGVSEGFTILQ